MNIGVTLIGQMITFILLIFLVQKYLYGPLSALMEARKRKIAEGLEAAERGKNEQQLAERRATELLSEAKVKAAEILAMAEKRGTDLREEAKGIAREEAEQIMVAGRAELSSEVSRARNDLRQKVAELSVEGAQKILQKEEDAKVHAQLLDRVIAQL